MTAGIPVRNALDLGGNALNNATFQILSADPGSPFAGQFWFNSSSRTLKFYDGVAVQSVGVLSTPLNNFATPGGSVSLGGYRLTTLADPSSASDAATKNYVDAVAAGLSIRDSVLCASTAALPANTYANGSGGVGATLTAAANGALLVDGQSPAAGARVLVKNEASSASNGIYAVTQAGDSTHPYILTRAADFNSSTNILTGCFCFVEAGTAQAATGWVLGTQGSITPGTTALAFTQFLGALAYSAGTGITIAGGVIALNRYAATIGDGSSTSIAVVHNLGSRDVQVSVYQTATPYDEVLCEIQRTDANTATLLFGNAPASNSLRVVIN